MTATDPPYTDYRCSMCGQIGGDTTTGPYDGCPKNKGKKHDMAGGKV
jgi:DNA-directed RNA polymerase subunit RPC12/RpoP